MIGVMGFMSFLLLGNGEGTDAFSRTRRKFSERPFAGL
jgi:hypothetical protein